MTMYNVSTHLYFYCSTYGHFYVCLFCSEPHLHLSINAGNPLMSPRGLNLGSAIPSPSEKTHLYFHSFLMPHPTLQVSPPEAGPPSSPSRFATFTRALKLGGNSGSHPDNTNPADLLSIQELESRNASNASLATSLNQEAQGERPAVPAKHPARHHESNASLRSDLPGSHRHRESTAKSFLSVSPAIGPPNAAATLPLTSLYLVSGLPKSPQTWTLADPDSIAGVHHSEGAYQPICTAS
jgi:hypothetical protein